ILEVADVFVVNKSDLDGSDRTVRELRQMLELRHAVKPPLDHDHAHRMLHAPDTTKLEKAPSEEWEPPIMKVVAAKDSGVDDLVKKIDEHHEWLTATGKRGEKERTRAAMQFVSLLRERLLKNALSKLEREKGNLDEVAGRIAERKADPYALAKELADKLEA
ncbi:MAG: methylmalonyl Co-A mutase-associated GTPase MeaB, partial [Myxococcaceae bacterium]